MVLPNNMFELFNQINSDNLFEKLIAQLNKDFYLANIDEKFDEFIELNDLKSELNIIVSTLFNTSYDDYLNLLYRVDVSEKDLLKIKENDVATQIEQVTFLILKREYQKVWFKSNT
ncbi:hypothetical protein [Lutibacter citreus]|uniref:hypothetical protein n=1 Tax=Lutibacter citreus TaxID=2138210 RepID=UPI000DBE0572|nr:hypothetical protein [Lutibacter citreus]